MMLFGTLSVMALLPATLLLLTLEIVFSSYKSTTEFWTKKLAIGNLIINIFWLALITLLLLNPMIIHPFLSNLLAQIFNRSPEDIANQVFLIIMAVCLLSITSTIIDSYIAFKKSKYHKNLSTSEVD